MKPAQFEALITLTGCMGPRTRRALRTVYVDGETLSYAARTHEVRDNVVAVVMRRVEALRDELPARMALIKTAMGETDV